MKKAEMEAHQSQYRSLMTKARSAVRRGGYHEAVKVAMSSWEYVDGMMQYERRYEEREFASVEAIEMVLKYAPLLLDFESLDTLEGLLKDQRRIEKNTSEVLADELSDARTLMWDAHRLWSHLEEHPQARQDRLRKDLGGDQDTWRRMVELWAEMGVVERTPDGGSYLLALATRMGEIVSAKCTNCGDTVDAPKGMLLAELTCPQCEATVPFVMLRAQSERNGSKGVSQ